ncbi:MAG: T9SS type A sorting domain-containing protein, partial [Ignavibacterium sp.]|nr:T9SS type A sorting domain-containing protein [Ignavibacterium sp.]MDW8375823.1 T9SS type A sorting domain-containing protein [Ignavibacteriales bacterium]
TMNTSGRTITRASTGLWTINGSLIVNNGTINFGSCNSKAIVSGNLNIGSSGTLTLSSASGGDLEVAENWTNSGTFNCNERQVLFNGSSQSLTGNTTFDYLRVNNTQLTLNNNVTVDNLLTFDNGRIVIGSNNLTLNSTATIGGTPNSSKMIVCTGTGEVRKLFTGTGSFTFPVGDNTGTAEYSPVTLNFTSGTFGSGAYAGVNLVDAKHPNNTSSSDYITRYWKVTSNNITSFSCNASFVYLDSDINGDENLIYLGRYKDGSWTLLDLTNASTNTLSGVVTSFSEFTGGEYSAMPVNFVLFDAFILEKSVNLVWSTATEKNNYGFEIERSSIVDTRYASSLPFNWEKIGFVSGNGNSNSPKEYSYKDNTLTQSGKYAYRLKQINTDGSFEYSKIVEVDFVMLDKFSLEQNYPNPFNPSTIISYQIPEYNFVTLKVYDIIGNEIATLVNEYKEAGRYDVEFNSELVGKQISNGVYIYKIQAGDFIQSKKMILIK